MSGKIGKRTVFIEKNYISYDDPLGPIECNFKKSTELFFKKSKIVKLGHRTSGKESEIFFLVTYYAV